MSRPLRIEYPGAVYHITSRGNEKKPVFKDDEDRETFLRILTHVNKRYHWLCHAYCLVDNHYHLTLRPLRLCEFTFSVFQPRLRTPAH